MGPWGVVGGEESWCKLSEEFSFRVDLGRWSGGRSLRDSFECCFFRGYYLGSDFGWKYISRQISDDWSCMRFEYDDSSCVSFISTSWR